MLADFTHTRVCKPICAKLLTLPGRKRLWPAPAAAGPGAAGGAMGAAIDIPSPRRLSKRGALPLECGAPAFRAPSGIWGAGPCDGRLNQRFRRDYAAAGYPGATGFLKKSPLSDESSESGLHFITSGSYHHPLKRLRTSLHSSAPPAAVSSSANQSRGFAPSPVSGTAAFSEAPQTVQTPS